MFGFGENAEDYNGNMIKVGDIVTIAGYCNQYVVTNIKYGGDMVDLNDQNGQPTSANSNQVIKVG